MTLREVNHPTMSTKTVSVSEHSAGRSAASCQAILRFLLFFVYVWWGGAREVEWVNPLEERSQAPSKEAKVRWRHAILMERQAAYGW